MLILALNTADAASAMLWEDGNIIAEFTLDDPRRQGPELAPQLDQFLSRNCFTWNNIDRLTAVTGPGSFTGLRIGLSLLHGIAFATQKPLIGCDLFTLYRTLAPEALIVLESLRDELFIMPPGGDAAWATQAEIKMLLEKNPSWPVAGNAAHKLNRENIFLNNAVLAALAAYAKTATPGTPPQPYYLRPPDVTQPKRY